MPWSYYPACQQVAAALNRYSIFHLSPCPIAWMALVPAAAGFSFSLL